jgi:hypothetical protein
MMIRRAVGKLFLSLAATQGKEEAGGTIPYWSQRFGFLRWGGGCVPLSLAFVSSVTRKNARFALMKHLDSASHRFFV